jgi:hypothetical protein
MLKRNNYINYYNMKKTSKPNALKLFNDNKANAIKKANATMKTFKKSLPKAQNGVSTPFQDYMKLPNSMASDTVMKQYAGSYQPERYTDEGIVLDPAVPIFRASLPKAKISPNQKALEDAWEKTYGMDYKRHTKVYPHQLKGTTMDQEQRRLAGWKKGQK